MASTRKEVSTVSPAERQAISISLATRGNSRRGDGGSSRGRSLSMVLRDVSRLNGWIVLGALALVGALAGEARADVAPGPTEYAFLGFGALMMAIPSGMILGTLIYLGYYRKDREEVELVVWQRRKWRRCIQLSVLGIFLGLVTLALVMSGTRRRPYPPDGPDARWGPARSASARPSASSSAGD